MDDYTPNKLTATGRLTQKETTVFQSHPFSGVNSLAVSFRGGYFSTPPRGNNVKCTTFQELPHRHKLVICGNMDKRSWDQKWNLTDFLGGGFKKKNIHPI